MHRYCSECGDWLDPTMVDEFITHPLCEVCVETALQNETGFDGGDDGEVEDQWCDECGDLRPHDEHGLCLRCAANGVSS